MSTAKQFIAALASQIGYKEGRDPDGNWNNDNKFGIWYGMNRQPWCAMFQSWGANEVSALGIKVPKYAGCTAGLNWFRQRNQTGVWPPQKGDIFILCEYAPTRWNAQANGWAPIHTGAVERWVADTGNPDAGFIVTIEGNTNLGGSAQGNGVYRLQRRDDKASNKIIYCRPLWDPEPDVTPGGGQSVPLPKPPVTTTKPPVVVKPPAPKPIAGATYTGSKVIDLSAIEYAAKHPNYRSEAARRWNGLVWAWLCKNSPTYARNNVALWMREPSNSFGKQGQRATQEMYRILNARDPRKFQKVTLPTWPGRNGVLAIGGTPVA